MTIKDDGGNSEIVSCEVSGPANRSGVDFEFECDNGESFVIPTEKEGSKLLGYCDNAQEIELVAFARLVFQTRRRCTALPNL